LFRHYIESVPVTVQQMERELYTKSRKMWPYSYATEQQGNLWRLAQKLQQLSLRLATKESSYDRCKENIGGENVRKGEEKIERKRKY
jgi:hypothetical protein